MSDLASLVRDCLSVPRPPGDEWPLWQPRTVQRTMAELVAQTVQDGGVRVVEAGAGVGKTLAYLLPIVLSGQRAVIATSNHSLQEQIARRDLPRLAAALQRPGRIALLKGRGAYLCPQRAEAALQSGGPARSARERALLAEALRWFAQSPDGDLAGFAPLGEDDALHHSLSASDESCLHQRCPRRAVCPSERARQHAREADWVVINHHMLFAQPDASGGAVAPPWSGAAVAVIDEAHALLPLRWRSQAMALSARELRQLSAEVMEQGSLRARGAQGWALLAQDLRRAAVAVGREAAERWLEGGRISLPARDDPAATPWWRAVSHLWEAVHAMHRALSIVGDADPVLERLAHRCAAPLRALQRIGDAQAAGSSGATAAPRWIEREGAAGTDWQLAAAAPGAAAPWGPGTPGWPRSTVFTSATLGLDEGLSWFVDALHLPTSPAPTCHRLGDLTLGAGQAAWHVPVDLPEPGEAAHRMALAERVADWASRLGGRTLVLTTTRRAAGAMAQALRALAPALQVWAPGQAPRRVLLQRFIDAAEREQAAVLVGSAAFWSGLDLPSDCVDLLVIDKLPFAPPDDPWVRQRLQDAERQGADAFESVMLADCAMALRQGAGRLWRRSDDGGLLVVADVRLLTRAYGPRLQQALPPVATLPDDAAVRAWLDRQALTRPSTRARPCA